MDMNRSNTKLSIVPIINKIPKRLVALTSPAINTELQRIPNLRTNHLLNKIKKKFSSSTHLPLVDTRTLVPIRVVILVVTPIHQRVRSRNRNLHSPVGKLLNIPKLLHIDRLTTINRSLGHSFPEVLVIKTVYMPKKPHSPNILDNMLIHFHPLLLPTHTIIIKPGLLKQSKTIQGRKLKQLTLSIWTILQNLLRKIMIIHNTQSRGPLLRLIQITGRQGLTQPLSPPSRLRKTADFVKWKEMIAHLSSGLPEV